MSADLPRFLPEYLRPQAPGRRSRRGLVLLSVVPFMLLAVPLWRVEHVRIDACPTVPQSTVASLRELVGQPAVGLDVEAIKERIQIWPGVGEVRVDFVLPSTIAVRAEAEPTLGSVRVGANWHGVGADGGLTGALRAPVRPVFENFSGAGDRKQGLEAAHRIEGATGARVVNVRLVTPADYKVRLTVSDGETKILHIRPQGSVAEQAWCATLASGRIAQPWADLRWSDRMVIGGGE